MAGAQTNFRAQDMSGTRAAPKAKVRAKAQAQVEPEPVVDQEDQSDDDAVADSSHEVFVPDGTVDEIMAWVGSDKSLAQAAKDKELANDHPRTTLLSRLDALMDD